MDNIQKSILAVLGIAAFATLIVPDGDSFNPDKRNKPARVAKDAPPKPKPDPAPLPDGSEDDGEFASQDDGEQDDELAAFGQPMNDARPFGDEDGGYPTAPPQASVQPRETDTPAPNSAVPSGQIPTQAIIGRHSGQ